MVGTLIAAIIAAAASIVCLVLEITLSFSRAKAAELRRVVREGYAELFASCLLWLENRTDRNLATLLASIENVRMVCADENDPALCKFEETIKNYPNDLAALKVAISEVRKRGREEVHGAYYTQLNKRHRLVIK